jgi:hypothetical protein
LGSRDEVTLRKKVGIGFSFQEQLRVSKIKGLNVMFSLSNYEKTEIPGGSSY